MYNPYALPHENKARYKVVRIGVFVILVALCVIETLALLGGLPNPALASFYGIAAVYTIRG